MTYVDIVKKTYVDAQDKKLGFPIVIDNADRAAQFPVPLLNQRVQNLSTGNIERWNAAAWVTEFEGVGGQTTRYNTKAVGLVGDAVFDDYAKLNALVNATMQPNGGELDIVGAVRIGTSLAIPENVRINFRSGAYLAPDAGVTITISGPFNRHLQKKFGGGGSVILGAARTMPYVNPQWWGAKADGVVDCTAAFNQAKVARPGGRLKLVVPGGTYLITDEILFELDRVNLVGSGQQTTIMKFNPVAVDKACFHFKKPGAGISVQWSLRGFAFDAAGNLVNGKAAIRSTDSEEIALDDYAVSSWTSVAKDAVGLQLRGRQTHYSTNYVIFADIPVSIEDNPNSTIDSDHCHFDKGYTMADPSQPNFKVADGVNITTMTITHQAWIGGSDGFRWVSPSSVQSCQQLTFEHIRWEQITTPTAYMVNISHPQGIYQLFLTDVAGGLNANGIKLRGISNAILTGCLCVNTTGVSLDVDSTVQPLVLIGCQFQVGGVVNVGTLKKVYDSGIGNVGNLIGSLVIYALPATIIAARTQVPFMGQPVILAADATAVIGKAPNTTGYVDFINSEKTPARFALTGATHTVSERDDPFGFWSNVKDTAASFNVYYDAPSDSYVVQNKRGGTRTVAWLVIGDFI